MGLMSLWLLCRCYHLVTRYWVNNLVTRTNVNLYHRSMSRQTLECDYGQGTGSVSGSQPQVTHWCVMTDEVQAVCQDPSHRRYIDVWWRRRYRQCVNIPATGDTLMCDDGWGTGSVSISQLQVIHWCVMTDEVHSVCQDPSHRWHIDVWWRMRYRQCVRIPATGDTLMCDDGGGTGSVSISQAQAIHWCVMTDEVQAVCQDPSYMWYIDVWWWMRYRQCVRIPATGDTLMCDDGRGTGSVSGSQPQAIHWCVMMDEVQAVCQDHSYSRHIDVWWWTRYRHCVRIIATCDTLIVDLIFMVKHLTLYCLTLKVFSYLNFISIPLYY